jgi:hypothetical protein
VADLDELESGDATLSASMQPQYAGELSTAQIISEMTESVALQGDESDKGIYVIWLPRVCFLCNLMFRRTPKVFFSLGNRTYGVRLNMNLRKNKKKVGMPPSPPPLPPLIADARVFE